MTILVATETMLLAIVTLLVVGLLRSHAELLRRLDPEAGAAPVVPAALTANGAGTAARDITGVTPNGDAETHGVSAVDRAPALLAFLSSGCAACQPFFEAFRHRPHVPGTDVAVLMVTHDRERESAARLRRLAGASPVVCSSDAWPAYGVGGSPYFVLVERGRIRGEGVAASPAELASFIADAAPDTLNTPPGRGARSGSTHTDADEALRQSGIGPGHPALYGAVDGAV